MSGIAAIPRPPGKARPAHRHRFGVASGAGLYSPCILLGDSPIFRRPSERGRFCRILLCDPPESACDFNARSGTEHTKPIAERRSVIFIMGRSRERFDQPPQLRNQTLSDSFESEFHSPFEGTAR
jgi:hypothetical protein